MKEKYIIEEVENGFIVDFECEATGKQRLVFPSIIKLQEFVASNWADEIQHTSSWRIEVEVDIKEIE